MYNMLHAAYPIPERMVYDMDLNKVVCNCLNITNGMIKDAVDAGARTFEEVQEEFEQLLKERRSRINVEDWV